MKLKKTELESKFRRLFKMLISKLFLCKSDLFCKKRRKMPTALIPASVKNTAIFDFL